MSAAPFSATGERSFPGTGRQAFILPPALCYQTRRRIIIVGVTGISKRATQQLRADVRKRQQSDGSCIAVTVKAALPERPQQARR
ncbi:hypothetical protein C3U77_005252 [Escherichia coli]|nr:hypothetical protein [Escherichia coli]EFA7762479.1 hypothetical protein [Escherichia coli]EFA7787503.1 hypothetical protein [Escherichia coli]EFA7792427.1 hypothetical protein [Escherichia coli]EFA7798389.1 hypothetical protein [Escherichia coli]